MPRTRSVATALDRRSFLAAAGALSASTGIGLAIGLDGGGHEAQAARPAQPLTRANSRPAPAPPLAPYKRGTTLDAVAAPGTGRGYRRLGSGAAWPRVTRGEMAGARKGREARRRTLAAFVQFTDLHIVDTQHPNRYEFLRTETASAWRPQEALSVQGAVSLVERVNALRGAPATGAPLGFVMTTGDNTDNNARCELDWFLKALSGGTIVPNSGDPRHYEGVQDSGLPLFWHPEGELRDADRKAGFPRIEGFLDAAIGAVRSPGLNVPWYSTVGNHDSLPGGCFANDGWFHEFSVGDRKLMELDRGQAARFWQAIRAGDDPKGAYFKDLIRTHRSRLRRITPDRGRAPFTRAEYLTAHLDPVHTGPGPVGHGYTQANLAASTQYYTFEIADDVLGISLDTTNSAGHYEGSLGTAQWNWLERTLEQADKDGRYAIVFSHHTSTSMRNTRPDPARPREARHGGQELVGLLKRHPRVLAWVNGHSHRNKVRPRGTFWEITTASHIDYPQLARVIEIADNQDGTLSLFTTLIESVAPHRTSFEDLTQTGLASLYRELSFNSPGRKPELLGEGYDRNTELLLPKR
ncbi:TIGR03767 family metallophosphoesterase [Streptomyces sp. TRM66268-LWL]|uniref:TIGR03767 family metallophosphoesterase n=1 Tax=Streptomyces polyasparticus TaxID=2767826 RepID=A0ABR7SRG1_9ACTN|nr:TIGR03767 family metallophosphoesterase [Streptomyces polyasparticus]MBC9718100.1 TIGR03767 family metallophosphoesterase [Streptomyces polyasparticus]